MKKFFVFFAALFVAVVSFAQEDCDVDFKDVNIESNFDAKRQEKLEKIAKQEKSCTGDQKVDAFINSSIVGAASAISSNEQLREMYKRQIGETGEDGVTDVTVVKPTLNDWVELGAKLAIQAKAAADAAMMVKDITDCAKNMKGLAAVKTAKAVTGAAGNWKIIGEEVAGQVKAVNDIIKTIKSAKNI